MTSTSTSTPTNTFTGTAAAQLAPGVAKVLAALYRLGEATAAEAGLGYSSTTPKLRTLENQGLAEPVHSDGRALWRLTDAGRAHAEQEQADADDPRKPTAGGESGAGFGTALADAARR